MMKYFFLITLLFFSILSLGQQTNPLNKKNNKKGNEISFSGSDGIKIYGDLYVLDKHAPLILLFHQGGSNARGEYNPIIPILIDNGYNVLAIDQRQGGQVYGSYNRTVAELNNKTFTYCEAYSDLKGALDYSVKFGFTGKKILWGSSYSASLAIKLAHENQQSISGVLAFSPASGGPMEECRPNEYFPSLKIPLLVLRPKEELEIESSKNQFDLVTKSDHKVYVAENGTHGSSMLVEDRVGKNVSENWRVVKLFLSGL